MNTVINFREQIAAIKVKIIDTIIDKVKECGANEIELTRSIVVETYDDIVSDTIERINAEKKVAVINYPNDETTKEVALDTFDTDTLLAILHEINENRYDFWEEISEE